MVASLITFGVLSIILWYAVMKYWRLPDEELIRRIRSAGTGPLLRATVLAVPGLLVSMLLATLLMLLLLVSDDASNQWERVTLGILGLGSLLVGGLSVLAAFTGWPSSVLLPQARKRQVREAIGRR